MFSREARVRLFLVLLILVLVLTNSQSLQVSHQSRGVLTELFESRSREAALRIVSDLGEGRDAAVSVLAARLENLAKDRELISICVLDWSGRLVTGGSCGPPESDELERMSREGFDELRKSGWTMGDVAPAYDVESARAFAYLALPSIPQRATIRGILRIEVPGPTPCRGEPPISNDTHLSSLRSEPGASRHRAVSEQRARAPASTRRGSPIRGERAPRNRNR